MTREEAIEVYNGLINQKIKEAFEFFAPELAESESERIRKVIYILMLAMRKEIFTARDEIVTKEKVLAYLEKQKEQKHPDGCFTCDEYKKGYEEGRRNGFTAGYNKAMKEVEQKQEYPLTPDECIKPTEWSEVELEFRGEKVKVKRPFFRDDKGRGYSTTEQDDEVTWNALRAWAESHGHTPFELYPREEWSEEDEEMRDNIICILHKDVTYMLPTGLNSCAGSVNAFYTHQTEIDWLKSLRPSPSWKPSEEQMKCLLNAEGLLRTDRRLAMAQKLTDLYEHLKKL